MKNEKNTDELVIESTSGIAPITDSKGINNNDEAVDAIAFANRRNQVLNPTSSLALEVLNAYEALADKTENRKTMIDSIARIAVDYNYVTPVRQKAYKLLKSISSSSNLTVSSAINRSFFLNAGGFSLIS